MIGWRCALRWTPCLRVIDGCLRSSSPRRCRIAGWHRSSGSPLTAAKYRLRGALARLRDLLLAGAADGGPVAGEPGLSAGEPSGAGVGLAAEWLVERLVGVVGVDDRVALRSALDALSEGDRRVLALKFAEAMSYSRVAQELGLSVAGAKYRVRGALGELRDLLLAGAADGGPVAGEPGLSAGEPSGAGVGLAAEWLVERLVGVVGVDDRVALRSALDALSEGDRRVLALKFAEAMSYSRVAQELGLSVRTAKNRVGGALERLRQQLLAYKNRPEFNDQGEVTNGFDLEPVDYTPDPVRQDAARQYRPADTATGSGGSGPSRSASPDSAAGEPDSGEGKQATARPAYIARASEVEIAALVRRAGGGDGVAQEGGHSGGGGGADHGGAGPGDDSGAGDPPDRADGGGAGEEPGRDDFGELAVEEACRAYGVDTPKGRAAVRRGYHAVRRWLAPVVVAAMWRMVALLDQLERDTGQTPTVVFVGRDGNAPAEAFAALDPERYGTQCTAVPLPRPEVVAALHDAGRIALVPQSMRNPGLHGLPPSGAWERLTAKLRSYGVPVEMLSVRTQDGEYEHRRPLVVIADICLRGTVQECLTALYPDVQFAGMYLFHNPHPDDPHPGTKTGLLLHVADERANGNRLSNVLPAERELFWMYREAVMVVERVLCGPRESGGDLWTLAPELGFNNKLEPALVSPDFRVLSVRRAFLAAALHAVSDYAYAIVSRHGDDRQRVQALLDEARRVGEEQVLAWNLAGDVDPALGEVLDSFVERIGYQHLARLGGVLSDLGIDPVDAREIRRSCIALPSIDARKAYVERWDTAFTDAAHRLSAQVSESAQARDKLAGLVARLQPNHPHPPTLAEIAALEAPGHPDLGQQLLAEITGWAHIVKPLRGDDDPGTPHQGPSQPGNRPSDTSSEPEPAKDVEGRCIQESTKEINDFYAKRGRRAPAVTVVTVKAGRVGTMTMSLAANGHNEFRGVGAKGLQRVTDKLSETFPGFDSPVGNVMWVLESATDESGQLMDDEPGHAYFIYYDGVDEQGNAILRKVDNDPTKVVKNPIIHAIWLNPNGDAVKRLYHAVDPDTGDPVDKRPEFDAAGNWINAHELELVPGYLPELPEADVQANRQAATAAGRFGKSGGTDEPRTEREYAEHQVDDARGVMAAAENGLEEWMRGLPIDVEEAVSLPHMAEVIVANAERHLVDDVAGGSVPGGPGPHQGVSAENDGNHGHNTPDPGTPGGGAGDYRDGESHDDRGEDFAWQQRDDPSAAEPGADGDDEGELRPAECWFDAHRPSEQSGHDVHAVVTVMFGREVQISPERLSDTVENLDEVGGTLRCLGRGSVAILVPVKADGTNGDVVLAVNVRKKLHYYDPKLDVLSDRPPPWGDDAVIFISVGYLDRQGDPLLPLDGPRYLDVRDQISDGVRALSPSERSQYFRETIAVISGFTFAKLGDVAPGSEEANQLAERYFGLSHQFSADYDYKMARYEAARHVTNGRLPDPFDRLNPLRAFDPQVGRYMADVIIANAEGQPGPSGGHQQPGPGAGGGGIYDPDGLFARLEQEFDSDPELAAQVEGRCVQESIGYINGHYADQREEGDLAVAEVHVRAGREGVGTMAMSLAANGHNEFRGTGADGLRQVAGLLSDPVRGPPVGYGMWVLESPTDADGRPLEGEAGHAYFVYCEGVDERGKAILRKIDRTKGINEEFDPTKINQRTNVHGILFDPNGNTVARLYNKRPEFDAEGNWINALDLELVPYTPELERDDVQAHRQAATAAGSDPARGLEAEPEHRPFRLEDFGEWEGYDRCGEIAEALQHKLGITVEIDMPDSAIEAARDVARVLDYFFGVHGRDMRVTRIAVTDPTQVLIDAGVADADELAEQVVSVRGADESGGGDSIILNHRLAQSQWAQQRAATLPTHPVFSAVFGDRPVLTSTLYATFSALVASLAYDAERRLRRFADRVLRESRGRADGRSDPGEYIGWRDRTVPDGGQGGAAWDPKKAAVVAAAALACGTANDGRRVLYGLLVEEAHAAAARAALLGDGGPAAMDRRGRLDLGAGQNLARVGALISSLGIDAFGFNRDGLDLGLVNGFFQPVVDVVGALPEARPLRAGVEDIDSTTHQLEPGEKVPAETSYDVKADGTWFAHTITVDASMVTDPVSARKVWEHNWVTGKLSGPVDDPMGGYGGHEAGHAVVVAGQNSAVAKAREVLRRFYACRYGSLVGYERWERLALSTYCFDAHGELNPTEAVAEGFSSVWHRGRGASEAELVLCALALREAGVDEARQRGVLGGDPRLGLGLDADYVFGQAQARDPKWVSRFGLPGPMPREEVLVRIGSGDTHVWSRRSRIRPDRVRELVAPPDPGHPGSDEPGDGGQAEQVVRAMQRASRGEAPTQLMRLVGRHIGPGQWSGMVAAAADRRVAGWPQWYQDRVLRWWRLRELVYSDGNEVGWRTDDFLLFRGDSRYAVTVFRDGFWPRRDRDDLIDEEQDIVYFAASPDEAWSYAFSAAEEAEDTLARLYVVDVAGGFSEAGAGIGFPGGVAARHIVGCFEIPLEFWSTDVSVSEMPDDSIALLASYWTPNPGYRPVESGAWNSAVPSAPPASEEPVWPELAAGWGVAGEVVEVPTEVPEWLSVLQQWYDDVIGSARDPRELLLYGLDVLTRLVEVEPDGRTADQILEEIGTVYQAQADAHEQWRGERRRWSEANSVAVMDSSDLDAAYEEWQRAHPEPLEPETSWVLREAEHIAALLGRDGAGVADIPNPARRIAVRLVVDSVRPQALGASMADGVWERSGSPDRGLVVVGERPDRMLSAEETDRRRADGQRIDFWQMVIHDGRLLARRVTADPRSPSAEPPGDQGTPPKTPGAPSEGTIATAAGADAEHSDREQALVSDLPGVQPGKPICTTQEPESPSGEQGEEGDAFDPSPEAPGGGTGEGDEPGEADMPNARSGASGLGGFLRRIVGGTGGRVAEVAPETAQPMVRLAGRVEQAYVQWQTALAEGESAAVEAADAQYRRRGQLRAAHTSAVLRVVAQAHRVASLDRDKRRVESGSGGILECGFPPTQEHLDSATAEYDQAVSDLQRAEHAIDTGGSSDPIAGDPPQWPGGSPLGWAAADLAARAQTHPTENVDLRLLVLNPAAGDVVAWVAKRTHGLKVGDLLVVVPGSVGADILRVDPTSGAVSVVPLNKVSKLSAVLFRPERPQADSPSPQAQDRAVGAGAQQPFSTPDTEPGHAATEPVCDDTAASWGREDARTADKCGGRGDGSSGDLVRGDDAPHQLSPLALALLDGLRSRADGIARRTGGQTRETLQPDGRLQLTVSPSAPSSADRRLESPAAGVRAGHYTAPTAWGEDLATLLGDAAWTLTAGPLGTTLTVELGTAFSATPALGRSAVPAAAETPTGAQLASGHDPSAASGVVEAGRTAGPGAGDDIQRALALGGLAATDARGRIDVVASAKSKKEDGSFVAIRGVGHVGSVMRWGDEGPVLELKVVEGEDNGDLMHCALGELAGAPGASPGSLALERVYGVTVNCELEYVIDHHDGSGYALVDYRQPDLDDPVFATVIDMINAAFAKRISAYRPRAGSFAVKHAIQVSPPVGRRPETTLYVIDYSIDTDGQITFESIYQNTTHSHNLVPDAGQRPWSAVVAYHEVQAARGGDRAARAVVFDKYAPVVRAVLGQAGGDDAPIWAIIDRAVDSFGAFVGGSVTDWFRRAAELTWVQTQAQRFNLGEAGVAVLRGLLAAKGPEAQVRLAGDARTVTVTLTVDDSVYPTVPGLTDAAAEAAELVEYQIRHAGAGREIRVTFSALLNTLGVDVIDFEQRWQRHVDSVQEVLRARISEPELVDELTERTRLLARELITENRAGDDLWFRLVANRVVDQHYRPIIEAERERLAELIRQSTDADGSSEQKQEDEATREFARAHREARDLADTADTVGLPVRAGHGDRGAGPGGPESHGGVPATGDGGDGDHTVDRSPGVAGGGAGDGSGRGGGGGHDGDGDGTGDGGAGHGESGESDDYSQQQRQYRAQDPTVRRVDTRFAEPLGEVVDNASDTARVGQLASDLSGSYGPYRIELGSEIELTGEEVGGKVVHKGAIFDGGTEIGGIDVRFVRDDEGNLVVRLSDLFIADKYMQLRGRGFSKALLSELERYYLPSGVVRIELSSNVHGSYAWAHRGFTWDPDPEKLQYSLDRIRDSAGRLFARVSPEGRAVLADIVQRLDREHPRLPEPIELADLATPGEPDLGRQLLYDTDLQMVKYLRGALPDTAGGHSHSGGDGGGAGNGGAGSGDGSGAGDRPGRGDGGGGGEVPTLLRLSHGGDESSVQFFPGDKIQLGGNPDSNLVVAATSVTLERATVGSDGDGRLWIRDNDSTNGTWVNGDRLPPNYEYLLRDGDVIGLGSDYEMTARFAHSGPEPLTVRLSRGGEVVSLRLTPGSEMMLGQIKDSPLTAVFGEFAGMSRNHASIGVSTDGDVWIRDNGSGNGTWINGDRISAGRKVLLYSGDTLKMGGLETRVAAEPKPAELRWISRRLNEPCFEMNMVVRPGSEVSLGDETFSPLLRGIAEQPRVARNHATVGVTPEGRAWIRDNGSTEGTEVNYRRIRPHEPVALSNTDDVSLGDDVLGRLIRTHSSERPPLDLLLLAAGGRTTRVHIPAREELKLGSAADSRLAGERGIAPDHARIGVHPDGHLWVRAAAGATFVNDERLVGTEPTRLRNGDVVRLGRRYEFVARFTEPLRLESEPQPVALWMRGLGHAQPLRIDPGSDLLLGCSKGSPLHELLSGDDHVSHNHASIGVHPSGRVWIRDNGSRNGAWLNGKRIESGRKIGLRPADVIRIGQFETTVEFSAPPLPDSIELVDRSVETNKAVEDMALIPPAVYDRIMEHLEALSSGGVKLGKRALADLPRVEGMRPFLPGWVGLYDPRFRRILIDTRVHFLADRSSTPVVLHEFGHAADDAYCPGSKWLSDTPEWATVHELVQNVRGRHCWRNTHYDTPRELFAEGFASWLLGEEALLAFGYGDAGAAAKLREYYDTVFGPLE